VFIKVCKDRVNCRDSVQFPLQTRSHHVLLLERKMRVQESIVESREVHFQNRAYFVIFLIEQYVFNLRNIIEVFFPVASG
jgi:hypothetical protein